MSNVIGIGHNHPPMDSDELELAAIKVAIKRLPDDFELQRALKSATNGFRRHTARRRSAYRALRKSLETALQIFIHVGSNEDRAAKFLSECAKEGITVKKGTPLASVVIRCCCHGASDEKVNRWANVLREATRRNLAPQGLAKYLAGKNQGVNALSAAYKEREDKSASASERSADEASMEASDYSDEEPEERTNRSIKKPQISITCEKEWVGDLRKLNIGSVMKRCTIKRLSETEFTITKCGTALSKVRSKRRKRR